MLDLRIEKLQIRNYRNLHDDIISFSPRINCIFGNNGNGKTNILEAIYYLINRKSFRKNTGFPQMLSMDCEKPEILFNSLLKSDGQQLTYSGKISSEQCYWYENNQFTKKKLPTYCEFVNPFDSFSFHSIPAFRRTWIDSHICTIDSEYKKVLNKYQVLIKSRNVLLSKKPHAFIEQVRAIDDTISPLIHEIIERRKKFFYEIKDYCSYTFKKIFDEDHDLEITMDSRFAQFSVENIRNYYRDSLEKDILAGITRYGIHKDDFIFYLDGINSFEYCSLGQQKMSFLSLIFAYIELFRYKFISYPLVLIDDVSGELDGQRWGNLIKFLKEKNFQVLITTANENFRKELERIEEAKKIYVDNGHIQIQ